ncbi:MAG: LysE family translocator [Pseudomonadota bacterium]
MVDAATLGLFLLAVLALFLTPGPNMAFVLSHGVAHGARGGMAAALGIALADLAHTLFAVTGITALVSAWAPAFDVLRYAGVVYLLWLAWRALRAPAGMSAAPTHSAQRFGSIVRSSLVNNLVNPKALLFFLVFLPQFVVPERGHVGFQLAVLGVSLAAFALVFHGLLGALSGHVSRRLNRSPEASRAQGVVLALVMTGLAARLLFLEPPPGKGA